MWWEPYDSCVWSGYYIAEQSCTTNGNDWEEQYNHHDCITECNADPACLSIEVGVDWGGSGNVNNVDSGRCRSQSLNNADCNGAHYNWDLWIKIPKNFKTARYIDVGTYCIDGYNMNYHNKTIEECAKLCSLMSDCLGFEYVDPTNGYEEQYSESCRPQDGVYDPASCGPNNLDYYLVEPDKFDLFGIDTKCGAGSSYVSSNSYEIDLPTGSTENWDRTIHGCANICDLIEDSCKVFLVEGTFPQYDECSLFTELGTTSGDSGYICFTRQSSVSPTTTPTFNERYQSIEGFCDEIGCHVIQTIYECAVAGQHLGYNAGVQNTHIGGRLPGCLV
jgi:hypothetical protein